MANYYTIPTNLGAAALANALANNTTVQFTHLALGDGNGAAVSPVQAATTLVREVHRVPISSVTVDVENPNWVRIEAVVLSTIGGWTIRELGLIGAGGKLLAVGNFPETYKPLVEEENASRDMTIRMVIEVSNASVVSLVVDPSVAVATNQSIANAVAQHEAKPNPHPQYLTETEANALYAGKDLPGASTTTSGIVELATVTEAKTGTDTARAVTPAGVAAVIAAHTAATDPHSQYLTHDEYAAAQLGQRARRMFYAAGV
ncbi:phage tail protein [Stutzerimonas kunmingensis]|uniref:phage tail protein n=1 Tax=Stutzerimonas kunmingensis TaxID=1211807 RepID=UPI00241EB3A2|nr:phage tail protein [Stutzerimonas kunmingensis]